MEEGVVLASLFEVNWMEESFMSKLSGAGLEEETLAPTSGALGVEEGLLHHVDIEGHRGRGHHPPCVDFMWIVLKRGN
jgi:hypothetical protein